jgi:hypothetical protein
VKALLHPSVPLALFPALPVALPVEVSAVEPLQLEVAPGPLAVAAVQEPVEQSLAAVPAALAGLPEALSLLVEASGEAPAQKGPAVHTVARG